MLLSQMRTVLYYGNLTALPFFLRAHSDGIEFKLPSLRCRKAPGPLAPSSLRHIQLLQEKHETEHVPSSVDPAVFWMPESDIASRLHHVPHRGHACMPRNRFCDSPEINNRSWLFFVPGEQHEPLTNRRVEIDANCPEKVSPGSSACRRSVQGQSHDGIRSGQPGRSRIIEVTLNMVKAKNPALNGVGDLYPDPEVFGRPDLQI
jgi:hypothetical protein